MPVVPTEQNRVGIAEVSGAKFRAPDVSGGVGEALADGAQKIGAAVADYAVTQDQIQDNADKLNSRNVVLAKKAEADRVRADFEALQGSNAVNSSSDYQGRIAKIQEDALSAAANPRQRAYTQSMLAEVMPGYSNAIYDHSKKEQFVYSNDTYAAEAKSFANDAAVNWGDPTKQAVALAKADASVDRLAHLNGWSEQQVADKKLELRSAVHTQAIDLMLGTEDPDVDAAAGYFEAHRGEMTPAGQAAVEKDLQHPLQWRQAQRDIDGIQSITRPDGTPSGVVDAGTFDPTTFKAAVRGPESGGNDNATNKMGSSASGRYQITENTFKSTYSRVFKGGNPEAAWNSQRFDPQVQEKLMDQLTADNQKRLKDAGLPVTNGTMYVMHVLGAGDGPKLLRADPNTPVASLLSPQIVAKNPTYFGGGKTVGEARAVIEGKVGGHPQVIGGEQPQQWDKAAAYDAVDARAKEQGWSPERTERAKAALDVRIGRDEQMLARQQHDADQQGLEVVVGLGDNFTSMNQIPRDVRARMSPETALRFQTTAQDNLTKKNTVPDDTMDSLYLQRLSREDPQAFANLDLGGYVGKISNKDAKELWLKQGDVKGQQNKPKEGDPVRTGITSAMEFGQKHGQVKLSPQDWPRVYDTMDGLLQSKKAKKGELAPADFTDAFNVAVQTNSQTGKRNFEVLTTDDGTTLPDKFVQNFTKSYQRTTGGRAPSRSNLIAAWIALAPEEKKNWRGQ